MISASELRSIAPQCFGWCEECKPRIGRKRYRQLFDGACQDCWTFNKRARVAEIKSKPATPLTDLTEAPLPKDCRDCLQLAVAALADAIAVAPESNRKAFLLRRAASLIKLAAR